MSDYHSGTRSIPVGREEMAIDPGLRKFMLGVYTKMGLGLAWSALLAYVVGTVDPVTQIAFTAPVVYIIQWGPLVLLLGSNFFMRNASPAASGFLYWAVVTLMGLGLGFWVYLAANAITATSMGGQAVTVTFENMAKAFLVTAAAFGGLALWGYTTKRNLSGLHSMVVMAIWGIALIGILNFALVSFGVIQGSSMFEIGMQVVTLIVFSLLVATQTNQLRESYYYLANDQRGQAVMTNFGALNLYIAFITIFQMILSLMSSRE
ncbi:MAG: Bax inhibitor-1/YccA family protein [Hyphomonadaceae bacterium]|nr:Bax inhibitor-1/YccA family protein [Hyphomonadaceae bacterium]